MQRLLTCVCKISTMNLFSMDIILARNKYSFTCSSPGEIMFDDLKL